MSTPQTTGTVAPNHSRAMVLQAAFLLFAIAVLCLPVWREEVETVAISFVSIVLEAFPFMLVGALVGGFIEVFVPREWVARVLPHGRMSSVFLAAGLGLVLPVCECAVVPVVRRLLRKGVPLGAAVAYLLAAPIVNPVVAASTAVAYTFSWKVVGTRLVLGYAVAVLVGFLMMRFFPAGDALAEGLDDDGDQCGHEHGHNRGLLGKAGDALRHASDEFFDVGRFLVVGAFFAAILQAVVSRDAVLSVSGYTTLSVLAMMALAVLLNLCSEADAFVAASFRSTGLPLSAQMAFMVLGPMLDIKLLAMYHGVFRRKAIIALCLCIPGAVLLGITVMEAVSIWF